MEGIIYMEILLYWRKILIIFVFYGLKFIIVPTMNKSFIIIKSLLIWFNMYMKLQSFFPWNGIIYTRYPILDTTATVEIKVLGFVAWLVCI